jgi:hypothetical protein
MGRLVGVPDSTSRCEGGYQRVTPPCFDALSTAIAEARSKPDRVRELEATELPDDVVRLDPGLAALDAETARARYETDLETNRREDDHMPRAGGPSGLPARGLVLVHDVGSSLAWTQPSSSVRGLFHLRRQVYAAIRYRDCGGGPAVAADASTSPQP